MALRQVHTYAFDTGTGSQTITNDLPPFDMSWADIIQATLVVTKADTDAGDTLNVYLQSRDQSGVWKDRIAFTQVLGNLSPSAGSPKVYDAAIQKFQDLSDDEEEKEVAPGSTGSHITAGTVVNGPFPGRYMAGEDPPYTGWRLVLDVVDADADGDFEGSIYINADCPIA